MHVYHQRDRKLLLSGVYIAHLVIFVTSAITSDALFQLSTIVMLIIIYCYQCVSRYLYLFGVTIHDKPKARRLLCVQQTQSSGDPIWPVSIHDRCPYMTGVHSWQVSLYDRCPFMTGVPSWRASFVAGVPSWQVSLHDRRPYITGTLNMGQTRLCGNVHCSECPLQTDSTVFTSNNAYLFVVKRSTRQIKIPVETLARSVVLFRCILVLLWSGKAMYLGLILNIASNCSLCLYICE